MEPVEEEEEHAAFFCCEDSPACIFALSFRRLRCFFPFLDDPPASLASFRRYIGLGGKADEEGPLMH